MATWICTIAALNAVDAPVTLRFADGALRGTAYYYEPRMKSAAVVYVSPSDGGVFKVFSTPNIGEIEVINNDGALDYLADYAVDGRACTLSLVDDSNATTDYFIGTVDRMSERGNSLFFRMKSLTDALKNTHPFIKYAGTNALPDGVEGVATDIKGNVKPKVWGSVKYAQPIFVNTSKQIYQVSDRSSCVIDAVYEAGAPITKTAGADYASLADLLNNTYAPAAGYWRAYQGYFRVGTPMVRTVTCDAHDGTGNVGDAFESIVTESGYTMDADSKTALNTVGTCGLYANGETSTAELLDRIAKSSGAYWYFNGPVIYAALLQLATSAALTLYDWSIRSLERKATGAGSNGVPITKITMQCDPVETAQTDVAGVVTAAEKARLAEKYRTTEYKNAATLTRHPLAETVKIEGGCLRSLTDGLAVCTRLVNLTKSRLDIVSISAAFKETPTAPVLGAGVTIIHPTLGYGSGKLFTVIGYSLDVKRKTLTLDLIG